MSALKRTLSDASTDSEASPPKKMKPTALLARAQLPFETPQPTELSLTQTFRLPSSKAAYASPPSSSFVKNKKISSDVSLSWKENTTAGRLPRPKKTYRSRKSRARQNTVLESPFATGSSSAGENSSPTAEPSVSKKHPLSQKRTLSDTGFLQNLPAVISHSTNASPSKITEEKNMPHLHRRPSEPGMSHPAMHTFQFPALPAAISQDPSAYMDSTTPPSNVDFNRPPSQLSMYDYNLSSGLNGGREEFQPNLDGFFADVQHTSTPFTRRERPHSTMDIDSDEEDSIFSSMEYTGAIANEGVTSAVTGLVSLDESSTWIEDSLISPPKRTRASRMAVLSIDSSEHDIEMGDFTRRFQGLSVPAPTGLLGTADLHHESSLARARSLDSSVVVNSEEVSKSVPEEIPATARRTRSGTIIAATDNAPNATSSFRRTRSGTVVSNSTNMNGSTLMSSPIISTKDPRGRNNTVVPSGRGTRGRNGTIVASSAPALETVLAAGSSSPDPLELYDESGKYQMAQTAKKTTRSVVQKVMGKAIGKWKARLEASTQRQHDEITSDDELDAFKPKDTH